MDRIRNDFTEQLTLEKMGIKLNIEMLLLADEMFSRGKHNT